MKLRLLIFDALFGFIWARAAQISADTDLAARAVVLHLRTFTVDASLDPLAARQGHLMRDAFLTASSSVETN